MVKVTFFNLLRSKYGIEDDYAKPGRILDIIHEIIDRHPKMDLQDFKNAVVFHNGKPIHYQNFDLMIEDNQSIIITHFVGGG